MNESRQPDLPEAPASATVKVKSPAGFEYLFTIRDERVNDLLLKLETMEVEYSKRGWIPLSNGNTTTKLNEKCPKCGQPLVEAKKKDGSTYKRCSTNKWDPITKTASGCDFVLWK